jgi:hypothetical protein
MVHLVLAAGSGYAGTVEVSNRTEVRVRHTQDVQPDRSFDVVDAPTARLDLSDRVYNHTLGYTAYLVAPDVQTGLSPQVTQSADVGTAWHDRRVRISLAEFASYGLQNTAYLLGGPVVSAPTAQGAPAVGPAAPAPVGVPAQLTPPTTLRTGSSRTTLTATTQLSRRWVTTTLVEFAIAGGLDTASRQTLPLLRGPRGEASALYTLTRLDALETRLSVQRGTAGEGPCSPAIANVQLGATCEPVTDTAQLTEAWRRRLTRSSQITLAGGAAVGSVRLRSEDPFVDRVYPVFRSTFEHERVVSDIRTLVRVDALLAPTIDVRTGVLDERAQASITLTVPVRPVTFIGSFTGARSVTSPFVQPLKSLTGVFEAEYRVSAITSVGAGVRYVWQEQEGFPSIAGEAAFVQATFHAPQARF